MIGRTVTIALALMVERNPLAPIATSASHLVRPGTTRCRCAEGYLCERVAVAAALGVFLALRELHAALRAVVAIGFFFVAELLLAWHGTPPVG
jgi:hypothetical protein